MFASDLGIKRQRVGPGPAAVTYDVNLLQQMVGPALGGAPYGMGVDAFGVPGMMVGTLGAGQGDNEAAIRGRWTKDEDDKLRTLCLGQTNIAWQRIAEQIDGRNTKQCRERWMGFWTRPSNTRGGRQKRIASCARATCISTATAGPRS